MSRKNSLFNKTLNTRYFGRKATFYDASISKPKHVKVSGTVTIMDNGIDKSTDATLYIDGESYEVTGMNGNTLTVCK